MVGMSYPTEVSHRWLAVLLLAAAAVLGGCTERKVSRTRWSTPDAFDRSTEVGDSRESTRPPQY